MVTVRRRRGGWRNRTSKYLILLSLLVIAILLLRTPDPSQRQDNLRRRENAVADASNDKANFFPAVENKTEDQRVDGFDSVHYHSTQHSSFVPENTAVADKVQANASRNEDASSREDDQALVSEDNSTVVSRDGSSDLRHSLVGGKKATTQAEAQSLRSEKTTEKSKETNSGPTSRDTPEVDEVESAATSDVSLREKLRLRSLEVKDLISNKLMEAYQGWTPAEQPRYIHYQHTHTITETTSRSCDQADAFRGTPVDGWVPPGGSPMQYIEKWERESKAAVTKIKEASSGGSELRDFAKDEVLHLRELRHNLFCGYY